MSMENTGKVKLAIDGGAPAKKTPEPPMYPGGMAIDQEEEATVLEVLRSKRLFRYCGLGEGPPKVAQLEEVFAAHMGTRRALAVTSGTAALICGLQGIGVGPGDEVIVPAYTSIASAPAVLALGGIPVPAEVDESLTLDSADVENRITPQTKAVMPVHMRGAPAKMDEIVAVARKHGLKVIEDAAQADGGSYQGRGLGSIGDVGCFSLQFNKIITAGEGGMVISDDDDIWTRATMFHDVAGGQRNNVLLEERVWGINFRMPELFGGGDAGAVAPPRRAAGCDARAQAVAQVGDGGGGQAQGNHLPHHERSGRGYGHRPRLLHRQPGDGCARLRRAAGGEHRRRPDRTDYHIYCHWQPIVNHASWTAAGAPWCWAHRDVRYTPDVCPRTLELLGRAVHMNVSPLLRNEDIEEMLEGTNRVLEALADSVKPVARGTLCCASA